MTALARRGGWYGSEIDPPDENLDTYAEAEQERIETFIDGYEERAADGSDMEISIRNQRQRLEQPEERIEQRKEELSRREQIISLAPEIEA